MLPPAMEVPHSMPLLPSPELLPYVVYRTCNICLRHLCNIPKKGLSRPQEEVLRSLTTQGCCVERRHCFTMVGGDNVAESMASVTKHQLRRHGLSRNAKDPIEHRNTLAVHYLNKNPGLEAVLSALARFRTTVSQGLVAPSRAFLEAPWEK